MSGPSTFVFDISSNTSYTTNAGYINFRHGGSYQSLGKGSTYVSGNKLTTQYKRKPQTLKNIIRSKNRKILSKKSYLTKNYKHKKSQKILTKISKSKSFRRSIK